MRKKIRKIKKSFIFITAAAVMLTLFITVPQIYASASEYTIPDDCIIQDTAFYEAVTDILPGKSNGDTILPDDVSAITELDVSNTGITDLTGIEYFTALTQLICRNNKITKLDVSSNTALEELDFYKNQISDIDLSSNIALTSLDCGFNNLTNLDVTQNTALTSLKCDYNELTDLDISANTALKILHCDSNNLTQLDVSNNTALTQLYCLTNQLTDLDLSNNLLLEVLYCNSNQLKTLDVSNNTALADFNCSWNDLRALDVTGLDLSKFLNVTNNFLPGESAVKGFTGVWDDNNYIFNPQREPDCNNPYCMCENCAGDDCICEKYISPFPDDSKEDFVWRLYVNVLRRYNWDADPGFYEWVRRLEDNEYDGCTIVFGFYFSIEFLTTDTTNEQFVANLYATIMRRDYRLDPQSRIWIDRLYDGTSRDEVIKGFLNSEEFSQMAQQYGIETGEAIPKPEEAIRSFISRLYVHVLGRTPEASGFELDGNNVGGIQIWTHRLLNDECTGSQVARGFFTSPEYLERERTDAQYTDDLYWAILGHDPAPDPGREEQIRRLTEEEWTREMLFEDFVNSAEFAGICDYYGINP